MNGDSDGDVPDVLEESGYRQQKENSERDASPSDISKYIHDAI